MADVEVVRRLVQHEDARFLCEGTGDEDALALAAGKTEEAARGQRQDVHCGQCVADDPSVTDGVAVVRQPAHLHHLGDREVELDLGLLRQRGDVTGHTQSLVDVHAVDEHGAGVRFQGAVDAAHRGGLATAVRADEADDLVLGPQRDVRDDALDGHIGDFEAHQRPPNT